MRGAQSSQPLRYVDFEYSLIFPKVCKAREIQTIVCVVRFKVQGSFISRYFHFPIHIYGNTTERH